MPFAHHAQRRLLRRGHDHPAVQRHRLAERKLRVARARRQIHEQNIQVAPLHRAEELLDGLHNHRPAPNHRLVALHQKPHAHQLHAVVRRRHHLFLRADGWPLVHAHHQRDGGAVNVAIQQADFRPKMLQAARQVHRHGGLADAAFAAGDGDDPPNAGHLLLLRPRALRSRRWRRPLRVHFNVHPGHPRQGLQRPFALRLDLVRNVRGCSSSIASRR